MTKAEIQLIRSLADKKSRTETGLFVAEGEKLVAELRNSKFVVRKCYISEEKTSIPGIDFEHISPREMERISHLKTPTGTLALVEIPRWKFDPATLKNRLTIALDEVQNPGNMGTIIRLADWFGVTDILCSEGCADCFNPKVVQATMGSITRVRMHYGALSEMIAVIKKGSAEGANEKAKNAPKLPVFGTFLDGENIYKADLPAAGIVVFGNEGRGISPEIERLTDRKIHIPATSQTAESLNVAISAAITISEFRRRG